MNYNMLTRNNKRLYEAIMRDVAKIVKKHLNESNNLITEGFFNSVFGTGTEVKSFINKIRLGVETLQSEAKGTIWAKLDPALFKYDEKQKNIIYTGDAEYGTDIIKNKPLIRGMKISSHLSDKEMKELADKFGKTALGQEIFKHSDEFKKDLIEKRKKQEKDPAYQGEELANLVNDYFKAELWKDNEKKAEYLKEMNKKISMYRDHDNGKFDKAYAKAINDFAKRSSNLRANINHCETVKKVGEMIGEYLNKQKLKI